MRDRAFIAVMAMCFAAGAVFSQWESPMAGIIPVIAGVLGMMVLQKVDRDERGV